MKIVKTITDSKGKLVEYSESVENYVANKLLNEDRCGYGGRSYLESVKLEEKPTKIAKALGRLLNVLIYNEILSDEEFFDILEVDGAEIQLLSED